MVNCNLWHDISPIPWTWMTPALKPRGVQKKTWYTLIDPPPQPSQKGNKSCVLSVYESGTCQRLHVETLPPPFALHLSSQNHPPKGLSIKPQQVKWYYNCISIYCVFFWNKSILTVTYHKVTCTTLKQTMEESWKCSQIIGIDPNRYRKRKQVDCCFEMIK